MLGRFWARKTDAFKQAAVEYPNKLSEDRREYLFTKPFGADPWGDDFCGKLHDFAHLVELLRLPAGASVLDIGCGPGWLTEYFGRLGYAATGIDISPEMIKIATSRIRSLGFPRRGRGLNITFAVMDSEAFELDTLFDAAIIYDALHHFADDRAVLRNAFTHLRPGGRLFLKEPLEHHPSAPETQAEVAEFGVLERGFRREYLVDGLTAAGFYQTLMLRQADLMLDEGRLSLAYVGSVLAATPAYHLLLAVKPGAGAIDSRWPGVLAADLRLDGLPGRASPGEILDVTVTVTNTGDTLWLHKPSRHGGFIRLGVQLLLPDGFMREPNFASIYLPADVQPGETVAWTARLNAPAVPGRYLLRFDLVDELISWFQDRGNPPRDVPFAVD